MNPLSLHSKKSLDTDTELTAQLATAADEAAQQTAFAQYQASKSKNTLMRQRANLAKFANFLNAHGASVSADELFSQGDAWANISFGLVEAFKLNLVNAGYALSSVNVCLSTIKSYAKLALKSGAISADEYTVIKSIEGYSGRSAVNVNAKRATIRLSNEKTKALVIPIEIIPVIKSADFYPDTAVGKRDRFIMCLLLDHALRASEAVNLKLENIDTMNWILTVYREKTNTTDRLNMSADTARSYTAYIQTRLEAFSVDPIIVTGSKSGKLSTKQMHRVNLTDLVNRIGKRLAKRWGLSQFEKLSAHDLRHTWATHVANAGAPVNAMMVAGGWSNPAMPIKYAVSRKIANEGITLPY